MLFFIELVKSVGTLWLGTFILARNGRQIRAQRVAVALMLWSLIPFCTAMLSVGGRPDFWLRGIVGAWPITIGCFFGLTISIVQDLAPGLGARAGEIFYRTVIFVGVILGVIAATTPYLFDFTALDVDSSLTMWSYFERIQSAEILYVTYTLLVSLFGALILTIINRRETRRDLHYLTLASWLWVVGIFAQWIFYRTQSVLVGKPLLDLIFLLAFFVLCFAIMQHNSLIEQPIGVADFWVSLLILVGVVLIFALLPLLIALQLYPPEQIHYFPILFTTTLAVFSHTLLDILRQRIDTLLLRTPDAQMRREVGEIMIDNRAGKPLDETLVELSKVNKRAMIREHVNKGLLRQLGSAETLTDLATSPLLTLNCIQPQLSTAASNLEKANAIYHLLDQALTHIENTTPAPTPRQEELHKLLDLRIRTGLDRPDITRRLFIQNRKYDRLLSKGVGQLADALIAIEKTTVQSAQSEPS